MKKLLGKLNTKTSATANLVPTSQSTDEDDDYMNSLDPNIISTIRTKLLRHPRLSTKYPDENYIREEVVQEYADAEYIYEKHFSLKKLREKGLQPHHPFKFKFALTNLCHFKANKLQGIVYTLPTKIIGMEYGPTHSVLIMGPYMLHWVQGSLTVISAIGAKTPAFAIDVYSNKENREITVKDAKPVIMKILETAVKYNTAKSYSEVNSNCQHFVHDICKAADISLDFSQSVKEYFKTLNGFKDTRVISDPFNNGEKKIFHTHTEVDDYVHKYRSELDKPEHRQLMMLLKAYDRGFWIKYLAMRGDTNPNADELAKLSPSTNGCAFNDPTESKSFPLVRSVVSKNNTSIVDNVNMLASPVRLLTIDGGGMRNLSSLLIAQALQQRFYNHSKELSQSFELIGGSSYGSVLATCLARTDQEVDAQPFFDTLKDKTFNHFCNGFIVDPAVDHYYFKTDGLKLFFEEQIEEGLILGDETNCNKLFVVSMKKPSQSDVVVKPVLFRTYAPPREHMEKDCDYLVGGRLGTTEENEEGTIPLKTVLEACVSTQSYFPPTEINNVNYQDPIMVASNPTWIALQEAKLLFPGRKIILVSIGAGGPSASTKKKSQKEKEEKEKLKSALPAYKETKDIMQGMKSSSDNVEALLQELLKEPQNTASVTYYRLNAPIGDLPINCANELKIEKIKERTEEYIEKNSDLLDEIVERLVKRK